MGFATTGKCSECTKSSELATAIWCICTPFFSLRGVGGEGGGEGYLFGSCVLFVFTLVVCLVMCHQVLTGTVDNSMECRLSVWFDQNTL